MRAASLFCVLLLNACGPGLTDSNAKRAEPSASVASGSASAVRMEPAPLPSAVAPGWQSEEKRAHCVLTGLNVPGERTGPCDAITREGRVSTGLMAQNTCAIEMEANEVGWLSSCGAYIAEDGSRVLELRGGGEHPSVGHSYFGREYVARILTPPPLGESQRFDVRLGCDGKAKTFDFEAGHSAHLGEVRTDTQSPEGLAKLRAQTGNDTRSVGTLTIHKWTEEEVVGSVVALDIWPSNVAIRIRMWFRLDWRTEASSYRFLDCDPYREAKEKFDEEWRLRLEREGKQ